MNADIRISVDFWSHPKTGRLMRAVGVRGVRSLQILWMWAARNRPDGKLPGFNAADIEFAADWRGRKGAFFAAILGQWLDETDEGFVLHDWQEHNPWAAEADQRSQKALFSKLAQVNPEAHKFLRNNGISSVSREEYEHWKAEKPGDSSAFARRIASESPANRQPSASDLSANRQRSLGESLAPSPSPSPIPSPNDSKERVALETARAEDEGVGKIDIPATSAGLETTPLAMEVAGAQDEPSGDTCVGNAAVEKATVERAVTDIVQDPPRADAPISIGNVAIERPVVEQPAVEPVIAPAADVAPIASATAPMALRSPAMDVASCRSAPTAAKPARRRPALAEMPAAPDWLPQETWDRWHAHRRALKKPLTPDATLLALAQLEKAKGFGHNPVELIDTAIANGWQGCVFPDKHYQPAQAPRSSGASVPRNGACRPLKEPPPDTTVYLKTAGFATELEAV